MNQGTVRAFAGQDDLAGVAALERDRLAVEPQFALLFLRPVALHAMLRQQRLNVLGEIHGGHRRGREFRQIEFRGRGVRHTQGRAQAKAENGDDAGQTLRQRPATDGCPDKFHDRCKIIHESDAYESF